jgi:hypothetical protein
VLEEEEVAACCSEGVAEEEEGRMSDGLTTRTDGDLDGVFGLGLGERVGMSMRNGQRSPLTFIYSFPNSFSR